MQYYSEIIFRNIIFYNMLMESTHQERYAMIGQKASL